MRQDMVARAVQLKSNKSQEHVLPEFEKTENDDIIKGLYEARLADRKKSAWRRKWKRRFKYMISSKRAVRYAVQSPCAVVSGRNFPRDNLQLFTRHANSCVDYMHELRCDNSLCCSHHTQGGRKISKTRTSGCATLTISSWPHGQVSYIVSAVVCCDDVLFECPVAS
jgi:hypothetical protein